MAIKDEDIKDEDIKDLTTELGISGSTLLKWRRQVQIDAGRRSGVLSYWTHPLAQNEAALRAP